jgi:hypothetical protein
LPFFGGVPISILYDNLKIAVARILGDGTRQRTRAFTELVSHYLFQERFGRPGKGDDKGKVEALVKYSRANFLTPVPHSPSFEALNAALEERCRARQNECAGRHEQTIGERLVALRPLPEAPFEPCDKRPAKVSSTALVRYRMNDYSVPSAYGFRDVLVKGFVDQVAIVCGADEIARHPRIYDRGQFVFDPKHYLALLEQKPAHSTRRRLCRTGPCRSRFSTCGGSWRPIGLTMTPEFLGIRGFIHFALFLISVYFGFIKK